MLVTYGWAVVSGRQKVSMRHGYYLIKEFTPSGYEFKPRTYHGHEKPFRPMERTLDWNLQAPKIARLSPVATYEIDSYDWPLIQSLHPTI